MIITREIIKQLQENGHHGTDFDWEREIAPEIYRLALCGLEARGLVEALETAGDEACECCNSSFNVNAHCIKAVKAYKAATEGK